MSKHTLTPEEREQRIERRATIRQTSKVELLREWHQSRSTLAEKRAEKAKKKAAKKHAKLAEAGATPRGVDRVPAHLAGNPLQRAPRPSGAQVGVQPLERDPKKQYGDERHPIRLASAPKRPRRRRDLPGAVARRLERRQKEWAA